MARHCLRTAVVFPLICGWLLMASCTHPKPAVQVKPPVTAGQPADSAHSPSPSALEVGKPIERELKGSESHQYPITLKAGQFLDLTVDQRRIDIVVRLVGPDGKTLAEATGPNATQGQHPLQFVAEVGGSYSLEVAAPKKDAQPGRYGIVVNELRAAVETDRARAQATQLENDANSLARKFEYDQAIRLAEQAATVREKALGPNHQDFIESLDLVAKLYWAKKEFAKAEAVQERVVAMSEKVLGPEHPDTAVSINNLANLYLQQGKYSQAEPRFLQALRIYEKTVGPENREVYVTLNNLGLLYQAKGEYSRAEPFYQRSLALREKNLGPEHVVVAQGLNNLAWLYRETGEFAKAEPLFLRSLSIYEKRFGPENPGIAFVIINLGLLYREKGDYSRAEPLLQRALAIREKSLGAEHPDTAVALNNLALLVREKGDFDKAEPLFRRALAIYEKKYGPEHREVAVTLTNLGILYRDKNDFDQAAPLFQRALAIREKILGAQHPEVAAALINMALVYQNKGDFDHAEPLYQRALAISEQAFGPDHPQVGYALASLAGCYAGQNNYTQAEPLYQRAVATWEKTVGDEYPRVPQTLTNLARLYQTTGDFPQAVRTQIRANDARERDLARNLISGSERQKYSYLDLSSSEKDSSLTLHLQCLPHDRAAARMALTAVLSRKGRALDAMTDAIAAIRRQAVPEDRKLLDELAAEKARLAQLTVRGPDKEGVEPYRATLKELEARVEQLESAVGTRSVEYRVRTQPVTLEAVQKAVPPDAVLVEFVSYRPYDAQLRRFGQVHYAVYVLKREGEPGSADLGEAEPIERLVQKLREALRTKNTNPAREVKPVARELDRLVMQPVRKLIGGTKHLLVAPDGELNLVPFAVLVDEHQKFLVETYQITYLTNGRDLLRLQVKIASQQPPLIFADPDYAVGKGPVLYGNQYHPLAKLPQTAEEARAIQASFPAALVMTESKATKSALEAVERPALLHIATHGYFMGNISPPAATAEQQRTLTRLENSPINLEQWRQANPLLRSFLFFAEANRSEAGTMTALEAANLNLWGTRLVVLSGCDTGVGDVKNGEGVYGLRRALVLAGSEAQMMSLWSVSDVGTRELMIEYYQHLKAGEGRSAALRHVQLKMLKSLNRRHPFYWASFIQSGEWANLEGTR